MLYKKRTDPLYLSKMGEGCYICQLSLKYFYSYNQVQAYTKVGNGALTDPVRADTDVEVPVPKLLLSTLDAVKITDCDKHENQTLSRSSGPPVDLAFISLENRFFWLNEMQELLSYTLDGKSRSKVCIIKNL